MRAGPNRQRITLMRTNPTKTYDALNQDRSTPIAVGTFWAKVGGLNGKEVVAAAQLQGQVEGAITMRVIPAIMPVTPADWFVFNGRKLNIVSVVNTDERNRELRILYNEQTTGNG